MSINVYINFNGNCREAVEYYAQVFETEKPKIMTFGDTPANPEFPLPKEAKDLVMHTQLNISESMIMFSDVFPGMPFTKGDNISLAIVTKDKKKVKTLFDRLKEGGVIAMELQKTFWSDYYGNVIDKFGIQWQISYQNAKSED